MSNIPLTYKGYPLLRKDNIIYYGNISDEYIVMLQILEKSDEELSISKKISVQLQYTDENVSSRDRIVKQSQKEGLYNAMDIAYIWLNRAVTGKN